MPSSASRNVFIDHLRVCLTALVILHHTAIVYGGSGGWYWRQEPNASSKLLLMFNAVNQSYFMGFFFLLAGYYTPPSFDRKGARAFLVDRGIRLGLPLLAYFFVLSPLTIALARTAKGGELWSDWWLMFRLRKWEPGPLWFAEALLIFALVYAGWRRWSRPARDWTQWPASATVVLVAALTGVVAFLVRLAMPVGENVAGLQLGYFPTYVVLFAVGCFAARGQWLERVTFAQARPWAIVSAILFVLLPVVIATRINKGSFSGGWTFNAAFYALWDPFISWGIILTLLWSFRTWFPNTNTFASALARCTYGAYIVHPPVLVLLSIAATVWVAPPLLKFGFVGLVACVGSFAVAALLLLVPGLKKIL